VKCLKAKASISFEVSTVTPLATLPVVVVVEFDCACTAPCAASNSAMADTVPNRICLFI